MCAPGDTALHYDAGLPKAIVQETRSNASNLIIARKGVALEVYLSRLARSSRDSISTAFAINS
jgi:hypothetical protein